jgi:AcrR family transcriptional regulator
MVVADIRLSISTRIRKYYIGEGTIGIAMRESQAKKRILETADGMFNRVGYADLNVNEIAHEANVSIGTLYYHFPNGKVSILMEIRKQRAEEYDRNFAEKFDSEGLQRAGSFEEGLEFFLRNLIEIHREERLMLAAMDSEVLSNLVSYDELAESLDVKSLMESDARQVTGILQSLIDAYPDEGFTLKGKEVMVNKVIDVLIHRYVFVESTFGSEGEFVDALVRITRALLV